MEAEPEYNDNTSQAEKDDLYQSDVPFEDVLDPMCCDPRKGYFRFGGLIFLCFIGFGCYFCFDTPGSLQDQIKEDMGVNTVQFASLYSLYAWPNVIMCFIGGFLIDKVLGIRIGAIIFSVIVTVGQIAYAFGALIDTFWMMQLGRFIFGIGGGSLAVAQNTYVVRWFKGKELNTVFALALSMARMGPTVNFLTMGPIYTWVDGFEDGHVTLGISLMIAAVACVFSLACVLILGFLDRRRTKVLKLDDAIAGKKIELKDVLSFPISFWLISIICVTYYVAIFPFIGLAKVFFMRKYNFGEKKANEVSSVVYIISVIGSPIFGFIIDATGRNIMWVFLAILGTLGCHALLTFTFLNPFIPMALLGMAFSLFASSLWPMVSLVIPDYHLGTAYGIMQSILNLGQAIISILCGLIVDTKGYLCLEVFYILWLCLALTSSIVVWATDGFRWSYLMMSSKEA